MKKKIIIIASIILIAMVSYRTFVIVSEHRREVFNPMRDGIVLVETMVAHKKTDILREPLFIKNNTALVSRARINKFRPNQRIGSGRIVSVSNRIDLDSGMHIIRTNGVSNGMQFAESSYNGFFIPTAQISNSKIMVIENGIATQRSVTVVNRDARWSVISGGINEGDIIVLSMVEQGTKVRYK